MPNSAENNPLLMQLMAKVDTLGLGVAEMKGTLTGFTGALTDLTSKLNKIESKADKGERAFEAIFDDGGLKSSMHKLNEWQEQSKNRVPAFDKIRDITIPEHDQRLIKLEGNTRDVRTVYKFLAWVIGAIIVIGAIADHYWPTQQGLKNYEKLDQIEQKIDAKPTMSIPR